MTKKLIFFLKILFIYFFALKICLADIQKDLINKLTATKTLSFNFTQKIADEIETGNCSIKYPLLMKCEYNNKKKKILISNGRSVAVIKKKYKKIYYYPIKSTPLFIVLQKEKIFQIIKNNQPTIINSRVIEFEISDSKSNKLKILFDKDSLEFKGWKTIDDYSNNVSFIISDLVTNQTIENNFFKIPKEEEL